MTDLWHVSEDPTIDVFVPHHRELHALDEELVWLPTGPRKVPSCGS